MTEQRSPLQAWRTALAATLLAATHFIWLGARWVNLQIHFDAPFQFVPGAGVLIAAGATTALLLRNPRAAFVGSALVGSVAVLAGTAASYVASVERALDAVVQSKPFALATIAATIGGLAWLTAALVRRLRRGERSAAD